MQEFMGQGTAYKDNIFFARSFLFYKNSKARKCCLFTKFRKKVKGIPKFLLFLSLDFFGQFPFMFKPKFRFAIDVGSEKK